MGTETGLNRLARVIEILGIVWGGVFGLDGVFSLVLSVAPDKVFLVIRSIVIGVIGYGAAAIVAWVIKGFAQKKA